MSWMIAAALLGAGAWVFLARWRTPGILRGHAIGAWLGVLWLLRAEAACVVAVVVAWQLVQIAARPPRARRLEAIGACAAAFVAVVLPRVLQLEARGEPDAWVAHFRYRTILESDRPAPETDRRETRQQSAR